MTPEIDLRAAASAMGRVGGRRNTPAQQLARARNGRKGGRPKGSKNKATQVSSEPERSNSR